MRPTTPTTSTAPAMSQSKRALAIKLTIAFTLLTALGIYSNQNLLNEFKDAPDINSKNNLRPMASITTKDQQTEEQMNKPTPVIQDLISEVVNR